MWPPILWHSARSCPRGRFYYLAAAALPISGRGDVHQELRVARGLVPTRVGRQHLSVGARWVGGLLGVESNHCAVWEEGRDRDGREAFTERDRIEHHVTEYARAVRQLGYAIVVGVDP